MGLLNQPVTVPPGGGGSGSIDLSNTNALLAEILRELQILIEAGQSQGTTEFNPNGTIGNVTPTVLYPNSKKVKRAIIQNLSTTDNYTITALPGTPGGVNAAVSAKGIVLNKVAAGKLGGDTLTVGNIDLGALTVISDTNTGQNISVYYET